MIALRFRNVVQGVDTISAHNDLIKQHGSVWWGWWKKDFEDGSAAANLESQTGFECALVDRSTRKMFLASAKRFVASALSSEEAQRVPAYYREKRENVFAWLELTGIEERQYSEEIANLFGDGTFISAEDEVVHTELPVPTPAHGNKILVVSDLHFGSDYGFLPGGAQKAIGEKRKTLTECICSDLKRIGKLAEVAAIVVTGDVTSAGDWNDTTRNQAIAELNNLCAALNVAKERLIILPGNHDIVRYPAGDKVDAADIAVQNQMRYKHETEFRLFVDELTGRSWKEALHYNVKLRLNDADVYLCILNSCTILATEWTEYGYVGDAGTIALEALGAVEIVRPSFKLLALHHHLLPVNSVATPNSKGVTLSIDAPKILDTAQDVGVQIALHGHEHQPRISRYGAMSLPSRPTFGEIVIVSNGSSSAADKRLPGSERNTYCLMQFDSSHAKVLLRELRPDGAEGMTLFEGDIGVNAILPTAA